MPPGTGAREDALEAGRRRPDEEARCAAAGNRGRLESPIGTPKRNKDNGRYRRRGRDDGMQDDADGAMIRVVLIRVGVRRLGKSHKSEQQQAEDRDRRYETGDGAACSAKLRLESGQIRFPCGAGSPLSRILQGLDEFCGEW